MLKRSVRRLRRSERGFSFLEIIAAISIIAVMSTVALQKFSNVNTLANTSKVQSDLSVINSAAALYQAENGEYPDSLAKLDGYIVDLANLRPPKGSMYVRAQDDPVACPASYSVDQANQQAKCGDYALTDIGRKEKPAS